MEKMNINLKKKKNPNPRAALKEMRSRPAEINKVAGGTENAFNMSCADILYYRTSYISARSRKAKQD